MREGLPPMREPVLFRELRMRIAEANRSPHLRDAFRVVHFSVQDDHVHMVVEAKDAKALARGVQGLAVRLARRTNTLLGIRGSFWGERFHSRELSSARAVRNAIVYVLMNAKKHGFRYAGLDPLSSAAWFVDGFAPRLAARAEPPPVRESGTWLGSIGWRRHGLLRIGERPTSQRTRLS
jgi:REP element-mobilizing transposase RayT